MLRGAIIAAFVSVPVLAWGAAAQPVDGGGRARYDGHKVVRVDVQSQRDLLTMQRFSEDTWACGKIRRGPVEFRVTPDGLAALDEAGIAYEVMVPDVQALIDAEAAAIGGAQGAGEGGLRGPDYFATYRTYDEISAYVNTLTALRPDLASRITLGQSLEGREVFGIRITSPVGGAEKPVLFLHTLTHAREWITGAAGMYMADQLVREYGSDAALTSILDTFEVVIVPVGNPDGYSYTWTNERLWRKNRRPNGNGTFGVDINRNWGYGWGGPGSSGTPANETFRGPAPFSEPETRVLRDFVLANPRVLMTLDVHSYSQLILSPWGYTDELPADASLFAALDGAMKVAMEGFGGLTYLAGPTFTTIYPASGVGQDWSYGVQGTLGWGFELRPATAQQGGFILPAEQIIPASQECLAGVVAAAEYLRDNALYFGFPGGLPEAIEADTTTNLRVEARRGRVAIEPGSARVFWRRGRSGAFAEAAITPEGNDVYQAALSAGRCGSVVQLYMEAQTAGGALLRYPAAGAAGPIELPVMQITTVAQDGFETDQGWAAGVAGDNAVSGVWERGDPNGTGAQPEDAYAGGSCYFTGQGPAGGGVGDADVDGGRTTLLSPAIDLAAHPEAKVSYWRWYHNTAGASPGADVMTVSISNNNGSTWTDLEVVGPGGPFNAGGWHHAEFRVADFVAPTGEVRVRFIAADEGAGSVVEAAVDEFLVRAVACAGPDCSGDWDRDGVTNSGDISFFLTGWIADVQSGGTAHDFDGSGATNSGDISSFLGAWVGSVGECG